MTREPTATALLREEHRLILRVVAAFERLLEGDELPLECLGECLVFFRLFTDACHHGKEDDLLFTTMESEELAGTEGPIALLREEHREGRALVHRLAAALDAAGSGDTAAALTFRRVGRDYGEFLRAHIRKEDEGVFNMADELVRGPACAALCAAYETACRGRFDGRSVSDLEALAARILQP